ncbi:glycerophosphodiester phosphodiesterase [Aeromonas cavernicola]|uniref:glycerophosphodiester phosphodiesterase n=1 Tax=Aeromonas cavernicola TaxID=1006623 RepID=A0A2H9U1N7_9GAMM|nr:glycerophosphodiester phosphodiesterase [Aeromonas cavernicola]PJG57879.1 glycerophosphodiester phosphodiesterase [Aeromonas cavernicola]
MKKPIVDLIALGLGASLSLPLLAADEGKIVIAHRGASGYLPEHTLASKAMAYAMGVDYLEQDLVMTKDDQLVVMHDHFLDGITDVASRFPSRARADGRYYVVDFTLDEVRSLRMTEPFQLVDGKQVPVYPERFPLWQSNFRIHTFQEEIEMIQGLNKSTGKQVGIYPEIKAPWLFRHEGKDISKAVLRVLKEYGYTSKESRVYLQSFDANELKRIDRELMPAMAMDLKLVQLMAQSDWNETMVYDASGKATPYSYDWMFKPGAMQEIASYAEGIGPWKPMVVTEPGTLGQPIMTTLVKDAHAAGLKVHPYTFRQDKGQIPAYAKDFTDLLTIFLYQAGVDGVFSDFPDKAVAVINAHRE